MHGLKLAGLDQKSPVRPRLGKADKCSIGRTVFCGTPLMAGDKHWPSYPERNRYSDTLLGDKTCFEVWGCALVVPGYGRAEFLEVA